MESKRTPVTLGLLLTALFWGSIASWLLTPVATGLYERVRTREESIQHQHAILSGDQFLFGGKLGPMDPWRNRVLFPITLQCSEQLGGLTSEQWYLLLRYLWGGVCYGTAFVVFFRISGRLEPALGGLALITLMTLPTFVTKGWDCPSDYPDVAFTALFLWAVSERRRWSLLLIALASVLNRESGAFAGVVWFIARSWQGGIRCNWAEAAFAAMVSASSYGLASVVRVWMTVNRAGEIQNTDGIGFVFRSFADYLRAPHPQGWPLMLVATIAAPGGLLWARRASLDSYDRRLISSAIIIALLSVPFGAINEIRIFLPSWTIVSFTCVRVLDRQL